MEKMRFNPMEGGRRRFNLKKFAWAAVAAVLFGFIAFLISGSDVSAPLGLLVGYLEYRL